MGLIKKLKDRLSQNTLLTIYKPLEQPHLDYGNIFDHPNNESFPNKLESIQYNAALAITGAIIQGSSKTKLYKKLGLEYFK